MSDNPTRDAGGQPGGPPPRPATRPTTAPDQPAKPGFRGATPGQNRKPQPVAPSMSRDRAKPQPQPADAAASISVAEDDLGTANTVESGQNPTTITTTIGPQSNANGGGANLAEVRPAQTKPSQTGGIATRPRTGVRTDGPTPGRIPNPTPPVARGPAQTPDGSQDDDTPDAGIETKDTRPTKIDPRDAGKEPDDDEASSSETVEEKQPRRSPPGTNWAPSRSARPAETQPVFNRQREREGQNTTTTTAPLATPPSIPTLGTISAPTEGDSRRTAFQQRGPAKRLSPEKVAWGVGVATALRLPIPSSQTRMLNEGLGTAAQITGSKAYGAQDQAAALKHEQVLLDAKNPPWGADVAMAVADAKVQLDLLSIPPNNRKLSPLSADLKSANKTFWIENIDGGGQKNKAFLCKPASTHGPVGGMMPSGGPPGGEVAREALAGRAAQLLLTKGLDIGMPETHVIKLGAGLIGGAVGTDVICSVQQFGASVGQLGTQSRAAKARIDGSKVAALGVFDMMTLANDRHGGNVLMGPNGELIPIDHGENFTDPSDPIAASRLGVTLAGCQNALLAVPSAHDPMPPAVAAVAASFLPGEMGETLRADRDAIAGKHSEMKGMISDAAIASAERATQFTRLAARTDPPISVAAAQVALGTHVEELFDPKLTYGQFTANAKRILNAVALQQGVIKEVCLSSAADYELLCVQVEKLGWQVQRPGTPTGPDTVADPMMMITLAAKGLKAPPKPPQTPAYPPELKLPPGMSPADVPQELKQRRAEFKAKAEKELEAFNDKRAQYMQDLANARDTISGKEANPALLAVRREAVDQLLPLLPGNQLAPMQARRDQLASQNSDDATLLAYRDLSSELTERVLAEQQNRYTAAEQRNRFDLFREFEEFLSLIVPAADTECFNHLTAGNVLGAETYLVKLEAENVPETKMREAIWTRFSNYTKEFAVPPNDPDLVAFLANLKQDIPTVLRFYRPLRDRLSTQKFPKKS